MSPMSTISRIYIGLWALRKNGSLGTNIKNGAKTSSQRRTRFINLRRYFLVQIYLNKSQSCSLANGLSSGTFDRLGLNSGDGRPSSNGNYFIRNVRKMGKKILCLCDFLIIVFDVTLCLFNRVFLYFKIFWHFSNH